MAIAAAVPLAVAFGAWLVAGGLSHRRQVRESRALRYAEVRRNLQVIEDRHREYMEREGGV